MNVFLITVFAFQYKILISGKFLSLELGCFLGGFVFQREREGTLNY